MGIRQNTWDLGGHYDLTKSGQNAYGGNITLFGWGTNVSGQLGQNDRIPHSSPVQIPGNNWVYIDAKPEAYAGIKTGGTLWIWGDNQYGELSQNDRVNRSSPTQVPGTQWRSISISEYTLMATKTDGTLWSWAYSINGSGATNSNTSKYSSPIQIPGTQWSGSITCARRVSNLLKTDGTLWTCGNASSGRLGLNDNINRSSPHQIPGTQWNQVFSGNYTTIAKKTDGTLWAWGANNNGQLGQNDGITYSSPRQIPGTQWNSVGSMGQGQSSSVTKTDGTLWIWGNNNVGQLGINDQVQRSSPIQIPGTSWTSSSIGTLHSIAVKTDGTLWSWGYNSTGTSAEGQLGLNDTIPRSSPHQIPGNSWASTSAAYYGSLATQQQ